MSGTLRIEGGAGGTLVTTEAISAAGDRMHATARAVGGLVDDLLAITMSPDLVLTATLDPRGAMAVHASGAGAGAGPDGLVRTAAELELYAGNLAAASLTYRVAEAQADEVFHAAWRKVGPVAAPVLGPALFHVMAPGLAGAAVGTGAGILGHRLVRSVPEAFSTRPETVHLTPAANPFLRAVTLDVNVPRFDPGAYRRAVSEGLAEDAGRAGNRALTWLANHPGVTRELVATVPMLAGPFIGEGDGKWGRNVPELAALAVAVAPAAGLFRQGMVRTRLTTPGGRPITAPSSAAGLVAGHGALGTGRGQVANTVRIVRVGEAGNPRWIVYPPATQSWAARSGAVVPDLTSNIALLGRQGGGPSADAANGVTRAMRDVGIAPGDPVLLAGYSQGGITAADIGADPTLRGEFNVEAVFTAASPTSHHDFPEDVQVLSLENDSDLVPQLDGAINPDRPNVTTVTADLGGDPTTGHSRTDYERIAALTDASDHRSVQAWRERTAPFLSGQEAVYFDVELTREHDPPTPRNGH